MRTPLALLAILRRLGFDYSWFRVYRIELDAAIAGAPQPSLDGYRCVELDVSSFESPNEELKACRKYAGHGARLFGVIRDDGVLVCIQSIWFGERYASAAFWPVEPTAAVSVDLVSHPEERGKGVATFVKRYSAHRLQLDGFKALYSRVWWTNASSVRVNQKAGWRDVGSIFEVKLPGVRRLRFARPTRQRRAAGHGAPT